MLPVALTVTLTYICRYDLMCQCWFENATHRPTFHQVRVHIENVLTGESDYLDVIDLTQNKTTISTVRDICGVTINNQCDIQNKTTMRDSCCVTVNNYNCEILDHQFFGL